MTLEQALEVASRRTMELHKELHEQCPVFHGNLAIVGVFLGYALEQFVVSGGQTDEQIRAVIEDILEQTRAAIRGEGDN